MTTEAKLATPQELDTHPLSILTVILSIFSLVIATIAMIIPHDSMVYPMLINLDTIICTIFWFQLIIDFFRSKSKKLFLQVHLIDMLASIPLIEGLRFARIFSVLRTIRLLKNFQHLISQCKKYRHEAVAAFIFLLAIILLILGSTLVLYAEADIPNANIQTPGDAAWWAFVTISTIGYGDLYPVTAHGRIIATFMIVSGVTIFGMITGLITSFLTDPRKLRERHENETKNSLNKIISQQRKIIQRLDQIERNLD